MNITSLKSFKNIASVISENINAFSETLKLTRCPSIIGAVERKRCLEKYPWENISRKIVPYYVNGPSKICLTRKFPPGKLPLEKLVY